MAKGSLDGLLDSWEPVIRQAFLESFYNVKDTAQIELIARMLAAGDVGGALRAVGLDEAQFRPLEQAVSGAFEAGGNQTGRAVPALVDAAGFKTVFRFNVRNLSAEKWLKEHSSRLVKEIVDDQRTMIRETLTDAMAKGINPRTAALDLVGRINQATGKREGGSIGLTSSQDAWVRNYAEELASDKPTQVLTRALRDKRFDAAVKRAEKNGEPIPADLQTKMVSAYRNRALRYRAENIARTEALQSLHRGQQEALDQLVASGAVQRRNVRMVWRTAGDDSVREAHEEIDGESVVQGQPFQTSLGPIYYPGDPQADPANTINCRCVLEPAIDFYADLT